MADDSSGVDDETGSRAPSSGSDGFGSFGEAGSGTDADPGWGRDSSEREGSTTGDVESGPERERIPIDLSGEPEPDDEQDEEEEVYAPEPSSTPIESGDPSIENVLFVLLGVMAMILVIFHVISLLF
ncbi:hypothetical protein AB7C87_05330 [Natrarchaeobius sp. A-rgal3]|uniref:DUF7312 domain-containing protein n=1 Tax=Natrarchaeobius versutus TaxID=1679078 RepID=UPI00350F0716